MKKLAFFFILFFSFLQAEEKNIVLEYGGKSKAQTFGNNVKINIYDSVLISMEGKKIIANECEFVDMEQKTSFFGDVQVFDSVQKILGDTLIAYPKSDEIHLFNHVDYFHSEDSIRLLADSLHYFYAQRFLKFFANINLSYGSYQVTCDSAYSYNDNDSVFLMSNVKIFDEKMTAKAELVKIYPNENTIIFYEHPSLDYEKSFVSGKEIKFFIQDQVLDSIYVEENSKGRIVNIDSVKNDTTILTFRGKKLNIFFAEKAIDQIKILENAQVEYQNENQEKTEREENNLSGNSIDVEFIDGKVSTITVEKGIEGKYNSYKKKSNRSNQEKEDKE